jgi:hypothetical protein
MAHIGPWRLAAASIVGGCLGCGGGGGSNGPPPPPPAPSFSLDAHTLTYSAASSTAATPAAQTVTGTVTGSLTGTLYIVVDVSGTAVASVSNFTVSGNSGQASIAVKAPSALGAGSFTGTIAVHACANDATCATGELAGSPQTVTVNYTVSAPTLASSVWPRVVPTDAPGEVVLRGSGFTGTTGVAFGGTSAKTIDIVSDTMIRATYLSGLGAGTQAITLTGGTSAFTGSVFGVGPTAFSATTLPYLQTPGRVIAVVFDAERQVLYVAVDFVGNPGAGQIWSYAYASGSWGAPDAIPVPYLRDIALSGDNATLYVLTNTEVLEYPAANPAGGPSRTVTAAFTTTNAGDPSLVRFAFANDGTALIASGESGVGAETDVYAYQAGAGTFTDLGSSWRLPTTPEGALSGTFNGNLIASADGSVLFATHNDPTLVPAAFEYIASTGAIGAAPVAQTQLSDQPAAIDTAGDKIVVTDGTHTMVSDSGTMLGSIPPPAAGSGALVKVAIVNPAGTRLYTVTADGLLHSFDLTATPSGQPAVYPELGTAVAVTIPIITSVLLPQPTLRTAITPDGQTLFIAGTAGVVVVPAPP